MNTLGDFQIIKEVAAGPLGVLYIGEHRFMKRPFSLKVLPDDLSKDRAFLKRFEEVVSSLAKLDHPNIAKVHSVSFSEGKYFLVTDFVGDATHQAVSLDQFLQKHHREKFKEEELLSIVRQIASALQYLHEKNFADEPLAHGGLKLSNVFVSNEKEGMRVALSDVGLARIFGVQTLLNRIYQGLSEKKTGSFSFHHELAFLSPEQKEQPKIDLVKGDIFAFGVLVYFLIMRHYPEGFFPLPSHVAPEYKLPWDRLIIHCLQPDPAKRTASIKQLMEELISEKPAPAAVKSDSMKPVIKAREITRPEFQDDPSAIFQKELTVAQFRPKPTEIKNHDPLMSEMVIVKGGNFVRGSKNGGRDELPEHTITLESFAIDIHPVTNEQYVRFLEAMGGEKDGQNNDMIRLRESRIKKSGGKLNVESGYAKHPVVGVTWYGANAYAKWVGKRLPTEAEWEIAACGGLEESTYPTGKNIERSQANFFSSDTTTVMSYPPNAYGLYDMAGNVYEWCNDWYGYHYYDISVQEPTNPPGPPQGVYRVLRGGCWKSLKEDMRCSHRHRNNPGTMNGTYGFRCAADVA